jgi:MFS family permease
LAWSIVGLIVLVNAGAIWLGLIDRHVQSLVATFMFAVVTIGFAIVGGLIVSRERSNSFGWLFIGMAVFLSVPHNLAQNYAVYALAVSSDQLPGARAALWIASSAFDTVFVMLMTLLVLLFPDGRPLTPRWRIVVIATVASGIGGVAGGFTAMTYSAPLADQTNPLEVSGQPWSGLIAVVQAVSFIVSLAAFVLSVVAIVLRYRRSSGVRRQQMQWVAAGVLFVVLLIPLSIPLRVTGIDPSGSIVFVGAIVLFPALMAVAILRHRLYDIDLVIRRTLVYTCLVVALGLVYLGGIVILGALFRSAAGESGALAVTISTLVVALAFQPARRRIQHAIDRRFSRRTADAEEAARAFSGRLREQIDLDALCFELMGVVDKSVQPRHATLWLQRSGDD